MRIIHQRNKVERRLDRECDLTDKQVERWNCITQQLDEPESEINDFLYLIKANFKEYKKEAYTMKEAMSLKAIAERVLARNQVREEISMIGYVRNYMLKEIENSPRKEGTKRNYRNAINQFNTFLKLKGYEGLTLKEFTKDMARDFKKYMETASSNPLKKLNTEVSSSTKVKNIKPIFNRAVEDELITKNPFSGVKLTFKSDLTGTLNIQAVKAIYDLDLSKQPDLLFSKDIFLFMCFTGLSFTDAISLSYDEIAPALKNRIKIDTTRNKTDKHVRQIIPLQAENILKKYTASQSGGINKRLFPQSDLVTVNKKLKIIAALAGLHINLSSKIARITCSELIDEAGLQEPLLVNSYMGWSSNSNIRSKYFHITESKLLRFTNQFDKFLDTQLK